MSALSPLVMIQLLNHYSNYDDGGRIFRFTRNNHMVVHTETEDELNRRKTFLSKDIREMAMSEIYKILPEALHGRVSGKVWIDPAMKRIAVPINESAGSSGFGILPRGSRIPIPAGKKIRAFTYWERVNDIDLSCFGLSEEGEQEEFSWRNMYRKQSDDVTFSGDETSGFNGGSEFFDIDPVLFKVYHPQTRWLIFCNNVFSNATFDECFCKAGFMTRDVDDSGEIFEPKTVQTSFRINAKDRFAYMFAIDLKTSEMIWLNIGRSGSYAVAGTTNMNLLRSYFGTTDIFNVYELFTLSAELGVANQPDDEEVTTLVTDNPDILAMPDQKIIHSWDVEAIIPLLQ